MKLQQLGHPDAATIISDDATAAYLLLHIAFTSNLLSEAGTSRLAALSQAAMSRLQNFLTPGAGSDLETMLIFLAPKGGGLPKVRELIIQARDAQTPINQNDDWWRQIFAAFGVQDPAVQQAIKDKTGQVSQPAPAAPAHQPQTATTNPFRQERATTTTHQDQLRAAITKNQAQQAAVQQRMQAIQAELARLGHPGMAEAIWRPLAECAYQDVAITSNLRFLASSLLRRLGHPVARPAQEVNWLKRFIANRPPMTEGGFQNFFRNWRHLAANPGYSQHQLGNVALRDQNERTAKLAVQLLSDHMTREMTERLKVANLTIPEMMNTLKTWQQLQTTYQQRGGKTLGPDFWTQAREYGDKFRRIIYAMNPELAKGQ